MRQQNDRSFVAGLEVGIPPVHQHGVGNWPFREWRLLPGLIAIAVGVNALAREGIACGEKPGVLGPQMTSFPLMSRRLIMPLKTSMILSAI